jgi:peptide/nickel transport system permease protein
MGKSANVLQGLAKAVVVIFAIIVLNFVLIRLAPGDPAMVMAGEAGVADQKYVQQLREEFGLDQPLPTQLFRYVKSVASFNLGYSYRQQAPVWDLIVEKLPATLTLTITAFAIALSTGVGLGILAARRVGGWLDTVISVAALGLHATPLFWLGLMAILVFSAELRWLPPFGMESIGSASHGLTRVGDVARHLILPSLTLGLLQMTIYARLIRASVLDVLEMDFVRTALAKGLSRGRVMRSHVLRNAVLPVITFAGIQAGQLVGGAVLTETVFAWPGIGRMTFDALLQRDYNLLLGVLLVTSVMVVVFNLMTDLVYRMVDPRVETA